jgi:hypothetical protein
MKMEQSSETSAQKINMPANHAPTPSKKKEHKTHSCILSFWVILGTPSIKMELTECSETSAYKIQTPGNHPKERIQQSEHGEKV